VAHSEVPHIKAVMKEALSLHESLRQTGGKMIFELRPAVAWDKGMAIHWILDELGLGDKTVLPVYIGDDLTDEDAFRELRHQGLTILVREENRPTLAHYAVENPLEVQLFLRELVALGAQQEM
jgi:trehalose-phosphatase